MMTKAWIVLIGLLSAAVPTSAAQQFECGNFPLLGDSLPEAERSKQLQKRAFACVQSGRPLEAIALFSELIGQQPENVSAYLNRGSAYLQARQFEAGVADFSHVIALRPAMYEAWYNRGSAFLAAGQYDKAIADLNETIRLQPNFARAYCNRAMGLVRKSDYQKAQLDLDKGVQLDPRLAHCYFARGDLAFREENYAKAIKDFTRGLDLNPNPHALVQRGDAYERMDQKTKALADYKAALALDPKLNSAREGIKRVSRDAEKASNSTDPKSAFLGLRLSPHRRLPMVMLVHWQLPGGTREAKRHKTAESEIDAVEQERPHNSGCWQRKRIAGRWKRSFVC
jgi:tetratricopeptide (TPR) repeat protein